MSISLSNAHARATVLSAVWSPQDTQLVAVLMAATDKTVLTALKAELEKNNKNSYVALAGDVKAELTGAKRGYVHLSASLDKANAHGHVAALLHWRAHDPRAVLPPTATKKTQDGENVSPAMESFFYVVAACGESLPMLFLERLQLALAWPLRAEWAEALLTLGREAGLVESLPVGVSGEMKPTLNSALGKDWQADDTTHRLAFKAALRVVKCDVQWGEVLSNALASHAITF